MAMRIHEHPLKDHFSSSDCCLCGYSIDDDAYVCETCEFQAHKLCAEAPSLIHHHPLHPYHPLSLLPKYCKYGTYICKAVSDEECHFSLDVNVALSTLPDPDSSPCEQQINVPFHNHQLTSFFAKWEVGINCFLCQGRIEGDCYVCSSSSCRFMIHRRCTEDRCYEDGTKVPRIYHVHGLELATSLEEEGSSSIQCWECESDISGEYLGCKECEYSYHRSCIRLPEVLRLPTHPNHALVLFIYPPNYDGVGCQSCSYSIRSYCVSYRCIDCDFALHTDCAIQILSYCNGGASAEIALSWHKHPMLLCHIDFNICSGCRCNLMGLAYRCKDSRCNLLLDKACVGLESKIDHLYHPEPDHPLVLFRGIDAPQPCCDACLERIFGFRFSCEICDFSLDVKCASRVPTRKGHLHEHNLTYFDAIPSLECNRCCKPTDSPLFRCVPCGFNLHEECMELPVTVKYQKHMHELVLWDSYSEDDAGDYYCDICEKERDGRLGVYVCKRCKLEILYRAHIECVLPELKGMFKNKGRRDLLAKRLDEEIAACKEEVIALEEKLEEAKAKLDKLQKKREECALSEPDE